MLGNVLSAPASARVAGQRPAWMPWRLLALRREALRLPLE
jgi:hypothetical protein